MMAKPCLFHEERKHFIQEIIVEQYLTRVCSYFYVSNIKDIKSRGFSFNPVTCF